MYHSPRAAASMSADSRAPSSCGRVRCCRIPWRPPRITRIARIRI